MMHMNPSPVRGERKSEGKIEVHHPHLGPLPPKRLCRNTGNIVPVGPSVISTPLAVLRTDSGRNLRSLTSVRDDHPVFSRCDTASKEGEETISRHLAYFAEPLEFLLAHVEGRTSIRLLQRIPRD